MAKYSTLGKKILLFLEAGAALSFAGTPGRQLKILEEIPKEWRKIDQARLRRLVREFYYERLVDFKEEKDGKIKVVITEAGKKNILRYKMDEMEIKIPLNWDGYWRIVMFDIPERRKFARDALRRKLKELGFKELQKSVFIFPYPCRNEIDFIVEVFDIRPYVRYAELKEITNEAELKLYFQRVNIL
jgi:DNA-binding transcriptional regulator PaaX